MRAPSELRVGALAGLAVLLGTAGACANKSAAETAAPGADDVAVAQTVAPGDELAQLEVYEAQMRSLGLEPRKRKDAEKRERGSGADMDGVADAEGEAAESVTEEDFAPPPPAAEPTAVQPTAAVEAKPDMPQADSLREQESRCVDLCSLSEAICSLEVRICEMSEDHADDATYADACERAIDDCSVSGDACNSC